MAGDRERYLAEGFTDYVSKPMTMQTLAEAIARTTGAGRVRA
jgi:CheY-like chemotaxis protein